MTLRTCVYCGQGVEMTQKETRSLHDLASFYCSGDCICNEIENMSPQFRHSLKPYFNHGNISDTSVWCTETKRFYRSKYEKKVALFLENRDIYYQYEQVRFDVGNTVYIPDFYLPQVDCVIEVKGAWQFASKSKMTQFLLEYPEIRFILASWIIRNRW